MCLVYEQISYTLAAKVRILGMLKQHVLTSVGNKTSDTAHEA